MSDIKVHKSGEFTVMSNYHLKDKRMSLKAKGILSVMLSLPSEWDYSVAGLQTLSKDGKDGTTSALIELEKLGYLVRSKVLNEKGQFDGYNYDIYERPFTEKPQAEKPFTEKPSTDNPPQSIINQSNIKGTNNKKKERKNATDYDAIIATVENEEVKQTLYEFVKMRLLIKKPLTDRALQLIINKLRTLSNGVPTMAVKILNESITHNWQDIYELKAEQITNDNVQVCEPAKDKIGLSEFEKAEIKARLYEDETVASLMANKKKLEFEKADCVYNNKPVPTDVQCGIGEIQRQLYNRLTELGYNYEKLRESGLLV